METLDIILSIAASSIAILSSILLALKWRKIRNKLPKFYFWRGNRLFKKSKYEKALSWYDRALRKSNDRLDAMEKIGQTHFAAEKYKQAEKDFTEAIALLENKTKCVAITLKLISEYEKRHKAEPDNLLYMKELRDNYHILEGHEQEKKNYLRLAQNYSCRARCWIALKVDANAKEDIEAALAINSCCANAYFAQACLFSLQNDYQGVIEFCIKTIEYDSEFAGAYGLRGLVYIKLEDYNWALKDLIKVTELDPKNAAAYANLGAIYGELEMHELAIENCTTALKLNPKCSMTYTNRGLSYQKIGEFDEAILDYRMAIRLNPKDASTYSNRAILYLLLQNYTMAIVDCTKAIELGSENAETYHNRGYAHDINGRYDKAIQDFTKAVELDPAYVSAYYNRAIVYDKLGKPSLAVADRAKADELKAAQETATV